MTNGQLVRAAFIARVHGLRGAQHRRDLFLRLIRVYPQGSQHIAIQETPPPVFIIPSKDICFKYFYDNEGGRSIREIADRYDAFARGFRLGTRLAVEGLWQPEEGT